MDQNNGGIIGKINTPTTSVASGVWSLDSQFDAQSSSIWPLAFPQTTFANSLRFNSGSTDYLNRTFGTATNSKKFTWSFWTKRTKLGTNQYFFENVGSHTYQGSILFDSNDRLQMFDDSLGSGSGMYLITTQKFRDPSAWYHIVLAVDSTQATASNRAKMYVNGVQVTALSTATYPSQNHALPYISGSGDPCNIGKYDNTSSNFDGYLTQVIFVDGQQLDPTSFGATNPATNIWEPITYTGTYGNNGFKLNFTDSSALGDDTSGNGNDFTVNNLTSIDQSTDTCSNNFATMNSLNNENTLSEGNLKIVTGSNTGTAGTMGFSSGKWYFEVKVDTAGGSYPFIGVVLQERYPVSSVGGGTARWVGNGGLSDGDIVGFAVDLDNNTFNAYINGSVLTEPSSYINTSDGTIPAGDWIPAMSGVSSTFSVNFGNPPYSISSGNADANGYGNFEYAVPSGYYAICTKNLAEFG